MTLYRDIESARRKLQRNDQPHFRHHTTLSYLAQRLLHQDSIKRVDTINDETKKARVQMAIDDIIDNILNGTPSDQLKRRNETPDQPQWLPESIRVAIKPKTLENINMRVPVMEKVVNEYIQGHIINNSSQFAISDSTIFTAINESYKWAQTYPGPTVEKNEWKEYKKLAAGFWNQNKAKISGDALMYPVFVEDLPNYIQSIIGVDPLYHHRRTLLFLEITEKLVEAMVKFVNTKELPLIMISSYKNKGLFKKFLLELLDDNGHTIRENAMDQESFMAELKAVITEYRENDNSQTMMQPSRYDECKTFETQNEPQHDDNYRIETATQYSQNRGYGPTHSSTTYARSRRYHPYNRLPTPHRRNASVHYDYHENVRPNRYADDWQQGLLNEPYVYGQAVGEHINGEHLQNQQMPPFTSVELDWQNVYQTNNQINRPSMEYRYIGRRIPVFNDQQTPITSHEPHSPLMNNQPYPPRRQFDQQQQNLWQNRGKTNSYDHRHPQQPMHIFNGQQPNQCQVEFQNQIQITTPHQHTAVPYAHDPFFESNYMQQQQNFTWSLMEQKNDTLASHQMHQQQPLPNITPSQCNQPSQPAPYFAQYVGHHVQTVNYQQQGTVRQNEAGTLDIMPTIDKLEPDTTSSNNHQHNEVIGNDKSSCIENHAISNILSDTTPLVSTQYINNPATTEVDTTFNEWKWNENESELFGGFLNNISNTENDEPSQQPPLHFRL